MTSPHPPLTLLHIDEHLVAIDKPPGLLVHRSRLAADVEVFALQLLRDQIGSAVTPVHRLDRGTSGVLVFARTPNAASALGLAFETGRVDKHYLALVRGWPEGAGVIDHPLARDPELPSTGQTLLPSRTRWTRLAQAEWPVVSDARFASSRFALVHAQPETGRRHQIRRHFKHIAHPLVGDATHGKGPLNRTMAEFLGLQRLWLHALQTTLPHPVTGELLTLWAEPGAEWGALRARTGWMNAESTPATVWP
jgi:tRNA pseudouridine65 synthase